MSAAFVDALLAWVFSGGTPAWVDALVDRQQTGERLEDFAINPVVPFEETRPLRVAIADGESSARWTSALVAALGEPRVGSFLALAPSGTRRMVDTDGVASEVYLDDLQEVAHRIESPTIDPLMCCVLSVPDGARAVVTRHATPPWTRVCGRLAERIDELVEHGAGGIWGVRWRDHAPTSVLWVSEARWRGDHASKTAAFEAALGAPPRWRAARALAARHGLVAYPDAVELRADGTTDVTVGFLWGPTT